MNRICNNCNVEIDENNYLKYRTVRKSCCNENRRKNNSNNLIHIQQPKIDKTNINNDNNHIVSTYEYRTFVVIGPRNVGKTHYKLKMLEKSGY